jgi:hypothetical protein
VTKRAAREFTGKHRWLVPLLRLAAAVLGGGVAYAAWLAVLLWTMPRAPEPPSFAVMLTASIVTAFGFAFGTMLSERLIRGYRVPLSRAVAWPLVGCMVGALLGYPFGPMFVGVGMFGMGIVTVATREAWAKR